MANKLHIKAPQHVAIIMDGNRRWAAKRGLGAVDGHRVAAEKTIEPIVERAITLGIKYLTFWAFSSENRDRDKVELSGLFKIFREALKTQVRRLSKKGVRIRMIGDVSWFPLDIVKRVREMVTLTKDNDTITVSFALNYGGRNEILRAVKKLIKEVEVGRVSIERVDEAEFSRHLDTIGIPDPDLIIRTGGEMRLSGYLPWQAVYAELYFTEVLFPDFSPKEFDKALEDFSKRDRRFGKGSFKDYIKTI
ncbi:di-trans,poly-cis-decaprenylcistransferase [Candidatus Woesebacteria bacterium RBG_19FT_COMBO_42_9]|uniref:Isoprenyl transferase n=1 Tax=Candidatus Woesebacteria bacterium RBG_16_42_24 TaxID=1802485 RepID=A0A1F7XLC2_9BACT|nr:MAG: di-trans,poly-cis-decaprenylcistransferase [Candidatus Woesebacteria bacterium RBG_16_42_24]OGM17899.1 MAG: di-trans,poly-cis-decaprenylcistransferase [Candidatus Woesebacteria bacterium RBG_19FT_COMBO_42_9]OGM68418.1 MAG: di-trans,poly-cis-decaprenylcistransferase [Candidatus Woesebacteria bacterium RIFCSPLOWO2_01_FULL_43_11]